MGLDVKEMQDCIGRVFKPFIMSSCVFVKKHPVVLGVLLSFFLLFMFLPSVFSFLICFIPVLIVIVVSFSLIFRIHQQNLKHAKGENRDCEFSSQKKTCIEDDPKVYKRAKSVRRRKVRANAGQVLQDGVDEKGMVCSTISNDSLVDKTAVTDENLKEIQEVKVDSVIDHPESSSAASQQSRAECGDGLNGGGAELEGESSEDEEAAKEDGSTVVEWTEDDQKNLMDLGISEMERNTRVESLMAKHGAKPIEWTEDDQKNLMDLGISEMERNARVESLMEKHRAKPIEWTEDDQKNLMDLGISEMERNARVESLMAKHRAKAIEWTEDDQKNLMDLGISEIERNRRLEGLIAKRKARKLLSLQVRRTLMNLGNNDPRGPLVSVLIPKKNPFLPNTSSDSQTSRTPGSAPPVLLPMHNPFDLPYDPQEEKPNLRGDSFEQEFMPANQKDMMFCRHKSFSLGTYAPPPWEFDDSQHETFYRPNSATRQRDLEIPKWSRSRNQSGVEDPSRAAEQVFNLLDNAEDKNEVHTEPDLVEEVTDGSGSSSSSEINVPFTAASKDEILRTLSFSVRKNIPVDGEHNAPLYDSCPSFIERKSREEPFFYAHNGVDCTPSHSIASDLQVEVSEVSSAEVTVDGPNSSSDSESPMTDNNGDVDVEKKTASGSEEPWAASLTQLTRVEENESKSRGVRNVSDEDIIEVGFSRFSQTSENPISLDMLPEKVVEQDPICTGVSSSKTGSPESSEAHSVDFSGKAHDHVQPPRATYSLEALSTDNLASPPLENAQKSTEKSEPCPAYGVDSQKPEEPSNSPGKSIEADIVDNNINGSVGNKKEEKVNPKSIEDGEGQPELLIKEKALTDPMEPPSDITSIKGPGDGLKPLTNNKEEKVKSKSVEDGEGQPELLIEEKALTDPMEPPSDIIIIEGPGDGLKPLTDKEEKVNSKSVEDGEGQPELLIEEKALIDPMEPPSDMTGIEGPGAGLKPLTDKKEEKVNSKSVEDGEGQPKLLIEEKALIDPTEPPSDITSIEGPGDGLKPLTDKKEEKVNSKSVEDGEGQPELLIEEKALTDPMEPLSDITGIEGPGDGLKPLTDKKEEKVNSESVEDSEVQPELLIKEKAFTDPMEPPSDITSIEGPGDGLKPLTDKKEEKVSSKSVDDGELLIEEKALTNPMEPPSDITNIEGPGDGFKPLTDNGDDIGNLKSMEENENSGTTERIEDFGESMKSKDVGGLPIPTNTKDNLNVSEVFDDKSKNSTVNGANLVGLTKPVEQNDDSNIPATHEEMKEPPNSVRKSTEADIVDNNIIGSAGNKKEEKVDSKSVKDGEGQPELLIKEKTLTDPMEPPSDIKNIEGPGDCLKPLADNDNGADIDNLKSTEKNENSGITKRIEGFGESMQSKHVGGPPMPTNTKDNFSASEVFDDKSKNSTVNEAYLVGSTKPVAQNDDSNIPATYEEIEEPPKAGLGRPIGEANISSNANELAVTAMVGKDDSSSSVGDSEIESRGLKQLENSAMDDSNTIENVEGKANSSSNENELAVNAMVGKDDSRSGVGDSEIESRGLKQSENSATFDSNIIENVEGKANISSNENELAINAMVGQDDSRSGVGACEIESQRLKQSENSEMDDSSTIENVEGNPRC